MRTSNILIFVSLLLCLPAHALTQLQFFPGNQNAMAIIVSPGTDDPDFLTLYRMMKVPVQNGALGPGKGLVSEDRSFNLVCGEQRRQCQVILNHSESVEISSSQKRMRFEVHGELADRLSKSLAQTDGEKSEYATSDRKFRLLGEPGHFVFEAAEAGVGN